MNHDELTEKLHQQQIDWKFNLPAASHMGGVWERQIRTVRRILATLLHEPTGCLDDESLHTLLCEVESIINSRPLTVISSDVKDPPPLLPSQILTMKTSVSFHHLANSNTMTYTCADAGVESNTSAICFGHVGKKSTCLHCSSDPDGIRQNGTAKSTMLSSSKMKTNQEMTGQWASLRKWNQTVKVSSGVQSLKHRPPSYANQCTSLSSY